MPITLEEILELRQLAQELVQELPDSKRATDFVADYTHWSHYRAECFVKGFCNIAV